jgi:cytochrome c biogenesis protein CcmG/thiol:disulfide interchange protein DsbE
LGQHGNPYRAIGSDVDSSIQLAIGSSGVPETFVIDGKGVIRHQHIGAITAEDVPMILAALKAAR